MGSSNRDIILEFVREHPNVSSSDIHLGIASSVSYATVKRVLKDLLNENLLAVQGQRKGTTYRLSHTYELLRPIEMETYFSKEIDERKIIGNFNHSLIRDILGSASIFTEEETLLLNNLYETYTKNIGQLTEPAYKKELERLAIDLSWKSSQIEGNTYTLLETERLLKDKETAAGRKKDEATMLLNHKEALDFIIQHPDYVSPLSISCIEDIHTILTKDLPIDRNIRKQRVGISGTNYKPLDNEFQIKEALHDMCALINVSGSVFAKSFLALVLISYIQPFADGNKRTARIISNAILVNNHYCPMSFRTVDSIEYKKAMLIFYEQNNISAFKKIFIDQFAFAVQTYF